VKEITKSFSGVLANDHINLDLFPGEVLAILGENGAGKSTLMKILYGFYRADVGSIYLKGAPIQIRSPQEARNYGIGLVFQDFVQIPAFTVLENIILFSPGLPFILNKKHLAKQITELSEKYDLRIDPYAPLQELSVGERQKVELIKLLLAEAKVLIFDEPTRNLAPHEIEGLFKVFANLGRDGYSVIFITHKLKEALECANRIVVMRQGRITGILSAQEASEEKLISLMFGETIIEFPFLPKARTIKASPPLLELKGIATYAEEKAGGLKDINLKVYPGEIVGIAGVAGNGQKEIGDVILGLQKCARGRKYLFGQEATNWSVARVRESGVVFIPEDPLTMAAFPWLTIQENMALSNTKKYSQGRGFFINWDAVRADLEKSLKRLGFKLLLFPRISRAV
jgi:simple sugar transport system ATP-binding protein